MNVDLTVYLLKTAVTDIDEVIPQEKRGPGGFERVNDLDALPDQLWACWVKRGETRAPDWCEWLEAGFTFGDKRPQSQSSGCVVVLETSGRVFAACFGTGWHVIPAELIERDFGLTVALNAVDPKRLRTLVTKSIDVQTRQRDTHQVTGAEVPDFALDLDVEWLRSAAGTAQREDCKVIVGGESLRLQRWNRPLPQLPAACDEFLTLFSKGTPEVFGFADSVRPIREDERLHHDLEDDLRAALHLRFFEHLSIGVDARLVQDARNISLSYPRLGSWEIEGLDDHAVKSGLDVLAAQVPKFDHTKVRLGLYDGAGEQLLDQPLVRLMQMEIDRHGVWYVRIEGRWLRCREEYVQRVNERVAQLDDVTAALALPAWDTADAMHPREENYNAFVATAKGWLLQDQKFWYNGPEKIEPCDLLTPDRHFIHVKKGEAASDLSHLFGQASGSADLLHRHQPFFKAMKERFEGQWPLRKFEQSGRPTVVLAIARPTGASLFGKMLLSRINVLEHARRIQGRGYGFAVCRVDLIDAATMPLAAK